MTFTRQFTFRTFAAIVVAIAALFAGDRAMAQTSGSPEASNISMTDDPAGSPSVLPTPTPTPKPKTTWGGLYIGAFGGANFSGATANTSTVFDANGYFAPQSVPQVNAAGAQKLNGTNTAAGIDVGYNRQRGSFV